MNSFFVTSLLILCLSVHVSGQGNFFSEIETSMPHPWNFVHEDGIATISSPYKVILYNGINMQNFRTEEEMVTYIKSIGFESEVKIYLQYEPAWGMKKYAKAKQENLEYQLQIAKLAEKYRIHEMTHKYDDYIPSNPDEEKRLKAYEAGRDSLEKLIVKLPEFESGGYSFYLSNNMGPAAQPWPQIAWQEANDIENFVRSKAELVYEK